MIEISFTNQRTEEGINYDARMAKDAVTKTYYEIFKGIRRQYTCSLLGFELEGKYVNKT